MSLTFQLETPAQFLPEALFLMESHAKELADSLDIELNLDMGLYESLFGRGSLLLLTARDKGVMVGYQVIQISAHLRAKHTMVAEEEGLYLLPEYRKGFTGIMLMKLGIEAAKASGAEIFYASSQDCYPIGALLKRVGFRKQSEIFALRLEKSNV